MDCTVCNICYESYNSEARKPLVLPCSHSFCKECLGHIAQNAVHGERLCAYCRMSWSNTQLSDLVSCTQLIPSEDVRLKNARSRCKDHQEPLTMWCNSCTQAMCLTCLRLHHKTVCDWVLIEEKLDGTVSLLKQKLEDNGVSLAALDRTINELLRARADLAEWRRTVDKEVADCPSLAVARVKYPIQTDVQLKTLSLLNLSRFNLSDESVTLRHGFRENSGSPSVTVSPKVTVGIDFGLKHSRVSALTDNGVPTSIRNELGCTKIPNYVAYTNSQILIGEEAKLHSSISPENTVYDMLNFLGCDTAGPEKNLKEVPFDVFYENSMSHVNVEFKNSKRKFSMQRVASNLFKELKHSAEEFLGCQVTDAIISVPAGCNKAQRDAVKMAGMMAGFNVLEVIDEAISALTVFPIKPLPGVTREILVYSFRASCINASVLEVTDGRRILKPSETNTKIGGDSFTKRLMEHCVELVFQKFSNDFSSNPDRLEKLRQNCEITKHKLSRSQTADMIIEEVTPGHDFTISFSRKHFEKICADLFEQSMVPVRAATRGTAVGTFLGSILLVGGGTLMPKVQEDLSSLFKGKTLCKSVHHPSEIGVHGAAIKAEFQCQNESIITLYD